MTSKKTPSYTITIHVHNKERTLRMEVPVERIQDKTQREEVFDNLMASALNMLGEPNLSRPTQPRDPVFSHSTYRRMTPADITGATLSELRKVIIDYTRTMHHRRVALVEYESRFNKPAFAKDSKGNKYLDLREEK